MKPLEMTGLVTLGTAAAWDLRSPDNVYRYAIGRCWGADQPVLDEPEVT